MKRILFYPFLLLTSLILIGTIFILPVEGMARAALLIIFLPGIVLAEVLFFVVYEVNHKNLSQVQLLQFHMFYRWFVFLTIFVHVVWFFLFIFFRGLQAFPDVFSVFVFAIPYFLVLWFLAFYKKIIINDVIKGRTFNILAGLLVIASMVFCIIISTQFVDIANFKAARFERILKTTFAENDLDKCIQLRENEAICVTYFAVGFNDEVICEKRSDDAFIKYCKEQVAKERSKK